MSTDEVSSNHITMQCIIENTAAKVCHFGTLVVFNNCSGFMCNIAYIMCGYYLAVRIGYKEAYNQKK